MQVIKQPAQLITALIPALPANYTAEQLRIDIASGAVFLVQDDQLVAAIQFTAQQRLALLLIAGKGCSVAALHRLCDLTERSEITCKPMTAAHERLYKRLGFVRIGEELVWKR